MYKALTIARYIIDYCNEHGIGVSNLKLQKILYFVQAEFLVATPNHTPCFSDTIEAWEFGPVVPAVYHQYKINGNALIPSTTNDPFQSLYENIAPDDQKLINRIINATANLSASNLVQLTHEQSPWLNAYVKGCNNPISNDAIRDFFEE